MSLIDTSGFNSKIVIIASNTFPVGFPITQFAEDAEPFTSTAVNFRDKAMGVNGDLITWDKASAIEFSINVIVGSDDDIALGQLAQANRPAQGKTTARDVITIIISYPDGTIVTFNQGLIHTADFGKSLAGSGRLKTKKYDFSFQNVTQ